MLNFIKKHKLILIILIFILFLLINTKVNAAEDLESVRSSILNTLVEKYYYQDESGIDYKSNPDKYGQGNVSLDKPITIYFIYNNSSLSCYDVISITTGYWEVKASANWAWYSSQSTTEHYVRTPAGTDWRNQIMFERISISYNYEYLSHVSKLKEKTDNFGIISINELFGITNCTYDNLLMVSPNYINRFKLSFSDFNEHISSNISIPFHLEYNEDTKSYFVYTDYMDFKTFSTGVSAYFNVNGFQTAFSFDSYENYGWKLMDFESSSYENEDGTNDWRYYQEIFEYGEYYFCLRNHNTETHNIYCIEITKDSSTISQYNENYTDSSDIFTQLEHNDYEYKEYLSNNNQNFYINYIDNIANVYSNYFKKDDSYYYDCLYSKDYVNYSDDVITEYYDGANTNYSNYYRFYKEIYENGTYYFRLRKIDKNTGSIISSNIYTVIVDGIVVNSVGENDTIDYYKNTNVVKYFREKLGIVFYPIDMVINFMERLENLSSQEPSITVPDIKEPFSRTSFY